MLAHLHKFIHTQHFAVCTFKFGFSLIWCAAGNVHKRVGERAYIGRLGERNAARAYCTNLIIYIYKVCLCCIRKQPGVQRRRRVGARFHYFVSKHRRAGAQKFPGNNIAMAFCPHPNHKHHQQCWDLCLARMNADKTFTHFCARSDWFSRAGIYKKAASKSDMLLPKESWCKAEAIFIILTEILHWSDLWYINTQKRNACLWMLHT